MDEKKLSPRTLSLLIALVLMALMVCIYAYLRLTYRQDFVPGEHYGQTLPKSYSQRQETLAAWGVDLTMPGTGGRALTLTAPKEINLYNLGMVLKDTLQATIPEGAAVTTDFVNLAQRGAEARSVTVTAGGRTYETTMRLNDLVRLYRAALEQNGLSDQFLADAGEKLDYFSARRAIRSIDKQLYDLGIAAPAGYPYDLSSLTAALVLGLILTPIVCYILGCLAVYLQMRRTYLAWLKRYNAEHTASWSKKAGKLPQFAKLDGTDEDMPDIPEFKSAMQTMIPRNVRTLHTFKKL